MNQTKALLVIALLAPFACHSTPAPPAPPQLADFHGERTMGAAVEGQRLSYVLHVPPPEEKPAEGWPLLLFLHGAGERGDDLSRVAVHGPPKLMNEIPELQRCVLVAPQCPAESWWRSATLKALLDEVRALADGDVSRVYVTGLSMGGYGTWDLLASYPGHFAAAVPICGGGDIGRLWSEMAGESDFDLSGLLQARDVPIRVYHGDADQVVPISESLRLVSALEEVNADVEMVAYPGVGHDSWTRTYSERELYRWLFAQRREPPRSAAEVVRHLYDLVTFGPGTTPDWDEVRALFVEEAVVVLRTGRDRMSVFTLEGFVNDFVTFIEQAEVEATGFTERVLDLKKEVYGDIARVLVRFDSQIQGSAREPREGLDSFELIRQGGLWKIVSIVNERPTATNPIPASLFR